MKKIVLFITFTLCFLLLSGCGKTPQKPPDETKKPESTTQTEATALERLQDRIADNKCMLGVGFIGYIDSESDEKAVRQFVNDSALASAYPFLKELDEVVIEGSELYAFVPADKNAVITVYYAEMSEDGNYIDRKDSHLYIGDAGEAVVVRCNLSEIYSNVLISVKDGANTLEFHPMISLENGRMVQEKGYYDFSVYAQDSVESARQRLLAADEVKDALQRGMKLLTTGDSQTIDGQDCPIFALGTDGDEQFVREQLYAVADDQIYAYSAVTDSWEPLGAG